MKVAAIAAALTFLLAGCSTQNSSSTAEHGNITGQNAGAHTLPIEAYVLTAEQEKVVYRAVQRLTESCMKKQGFDGGLPDRIDLRAGGRSENFIDRRYAAVYDEATARKYGLHLPLLVENPEPPPAPEMSNEFVEALYGPMSAGNPRENVDVSKGQLTYGGCMGEAEKALVGRSRYLVSIGQAPSEPVRNLNLDPSASEDPRVIAAQAEWSSCMAANGYRLESTTAEVEGIPGVDITLPAPSKAEIALALQEVKCQQETKVIDIWFQVESKYQEKAIDENAELFAEIRDENTDLIERAADLLGEETP